ncbi:MAG: transporter substrate-binding domain-containing protein, partial [Clostridia bacterium]
MKHTRICAVFILMALVLLTGCSKHGDKAEYFFADELSGKKIGIVTGMTSEKQVDSLIKNAKIKEFKTPEDGARALKDKQILALAVDALHTDEVLKDTALAPLLQNLVDLKYCAVFYMSGKTSEEDLTMQFDAALNKMIAD